MYMSQYFVVIRLQTFLLYCMNDIMSLQAIGVASSVSERSAFAPYSKVGATKNALSPE
eukprot:m.275162 g.275162  ORF g.275162 m.275162 type:complete len:58 (+) comp15694_c0_seq4:1797-1970(+)